MPSLRFAASDSFDIRAKMWDYPTMSTAIVDAKKRVVLPAGKPGDVYDVQRQDEGYVLLVRLEKAKPRKRLGRHACLEAMKKDPLRPMMKWDELRRLTREI